LQLDCSLEENRNINLKFQKNCVQLVGYLLHACHVKAALVFLPSTAPTSKPKHELYGASELNNIVHNHFTAFVLWIYETTLTILCSRLKFDPKCNRLVLDRISKICGIAFWTYSG
jgi:hypothetical protein